MREKGFYMNKGCMFIYNLLSEVAFILLGVVVEILGLIYIILIYKGLLCI